MQCPIGLVFIVFLFRLRFITRQFKGIFQTMYFTFTFLNDTYYIYYLIWNYVNLKYICKFRLVICTQKQAPIELVFALNCSHFYQSEKLFKDLNRVEGFNSLHWHTSVRVRSRFFDQVEHETMYPSSGNKHFFTKSCHCQTYQKF